MPNWTMSHKKLEMTMVQNTGGCTSVLEQQSDELINMAESPMKNSSLSMQSEACHQQSVSDCEYRIAVGSWNVAGMLPPDDIDLREWLDTSEPADIYVIGWVFRSDFCLPGFVLFACLDV
jgi:hypothetical protein